MLALALQALHKLTSLTHGRSTKCKSTFETTSAAFHMQKSPIPPPSCNGHNRRDDQNTRTSIREAILKRQVSPKG